MVTCQQICFIGREYNPWADTPAHWLLPYKDPCECTAVRLGGEYRSTASSSYSFGAPYILYEIFLSEDTEEIHDYFNCSYTSIVFPVLFMWCF